MNLIRNFTTLSVLLLALGIRGFNHQIEPQHAQNLTRITQAFDTVLAPEFGALNLEQFYYAENITPEHFANAKQFLFHKFPALRTKIVHVIQHELTQEQRTLVIELLNNIKKISTTTTEDLMTMTKMAFNKEVREGQNRAMKMYAAHITQAIEQAQTREERVAAYKELEGVVLHISIKNAFAGEYIRAFNIPKNFMCACVYLEDVHFITELLAATQNSPLKHLCSFFISAIAVPYVAFNDLYYGPNLDEQLKNIGDIFNITHTVSSQLLEEITKCS